ncbi:MAG: hypothetical protein IK137_00195 [Bacilli bacterium]|nr:hypothetical protein [Bacilli bacterium]
MKKKIIYILILILGLFIITGCSKYDVMKGTWKASIENQNIHHDSDNEVTGGKEDYYLKCDGEGNYDLTSKSGDLANARYVVDKNIVTFYDEGRELLSICKINGRELDCSIQSYYAFKYVKIK